MRQNSAVFIRPQGIRRRDFLARVGEYETLIFEVNAREERLTGVAGGARPIPGVLA